MQNVDFFRLCENFTFEVQKALFPIQNIKKCSCWLFLLKNKHKKGRFFDNNHGLTPSKMSIFFDFVKTFLSRISKNVSFWPFLLNKNISKKGRFFNKNHGLTPLQNVDFFQLCENFTFEVQKTLFSIQNIKKIFFLPFLLKKNLIRIRSIF